MKKINEKLSEIFDVEPIPLEEPKEVSKEIVEVKSENPVEADTEVARENIKELITKGHRAVDELAIIARDSQHPRAYEVMATLIKNMSDLNKDLLQLQKQKKELMMSSDNKGGEVNVNNALFVGSTDELMKLLKK
jgi:hypothetical protein